MNYSQAQLVPFAQSAGFSGNGLTTIIAIAMAESGGSSTATNSVGNSAGTDRGLVQINSYYHSEVSDACAFDPTCAFKAAFAISDHGTNFRPWATFGNGAYKKFMNSNLPASNLSTTTSPTSAPGVLGIGPASFFPQGVLDWVGSPTRIFKMLVGLLLIGIGLFMMIAPEAAKEAIKHPEVFLGA